MMAPLLLLVLVTCLAAASPAWSDDDQDRARMAVESGEVRPLGEVLAAVHAAVPGDVVAVTLKRKRERWFYKLKILTLSGRRREVEIDASTLVILDNEGDE